MDDENNPAKPGVFYGWYIVAVTWLPLFLAGAMSFALYFKPILEEWLTAATGESVSLSFVTLDEEGGTVIEGLVEEGKPAPRSRPPSEPPIVQKAKKLFRGEVVDE